MPMNAVRLSKHLSFVLRHRPDSIGLTLTTDGWADIDDLIARSAAAGTAFGRDELIAVVAGSDKQRFSISADGRSIRAAQGHSVPVELGLAPQEPPETLFHGTATRFLDAILAEGLDPRSRRQVHLSADEATAVKVAERHGTPVVLAVAAQRMHGAGFRFYRADNGVWLTDKVPPEFLSVPLMDRPRAPSASSP